MKKRIIAVISLVLIFCLGISLFVSCNKNEDQGPAKISIAYQDRELIISADGVQSMELFLTMTNQDGWDIEASSTGIVKDLEYDKEKESVIFAIDPSDSNDYRYGTITLTATKDGFDTVTWTLNIKQDIPTTTLVRFVDDMPLFPEKEGEEGSLDVFYRLMPGWEIGVQSSDWIEVELDKVNKKINYIVAPNLKSHTLSGNITLIATKEGEDPISCEIGVFQDYTNYNLSKETFDDGTETRVTEYKYDEDNQIVEEKISYFESGAQDPYQVITSTYTYDGDNYVIEKVDNNTRTSQIALTKEIYTESDTGYETILLTKKSDVWVNEQKETVEYTQGPNEEEITTSNIYSWKDDEWLLTSNTVSSSTDTDSTTISETTFEMVTTQYTNGTFSNCKKTLINVITNYEEAIEIETIIFSDIDDKGVETKTLIREITTIYGDYETTQNIKESSYTGEEYDLVLSETTKATVTYDVTGIEMEGLWYVETVEHSSLQDSTMVKDRVMKSYYNMDANVIKEEIITYNKSTGAVSSTITTEYKYDDNAICIEERSYNGGTLQGVYTYEYTVA